MAVTATAAPTGSVEEFRDNAPAGAGAEADQAHPVVDVRLDDLVHDRSPDELPVSGWLHLVRDDDGTWSAVEITVTGSGGHRFRAVDDGPQAGAVALLRAAVEEHHLVAAQDYGFGLLRVPSCGVTALWLRGDGHHHQMVVPLDPVPAQLVAGRTYPVAAFLDAVRHIARERALAADDLTRIEGIGPHVEEALHEAGVDTFAALAAATPERLRAVLTAAGPRFHRADPQTWPEQAALAGRGSWDELRTLQEELTGGRRR